MKFCRQCGTLLIDEAEYCPRCGTVCPVDTAENGRISDESPTKTALITVAISIAILVLVNVAVLATADKRPVTFADRLMETKAEVVESETAAEEVKEPEAFQTETKENAAEGEAETEAIAEEETKTKATADDYTGNWVSSDEMKMSITDAGDGTFSASIKTQISPSSYSVESATGSIGEDGAIVYKDAVRVIYVSDSEGNKSQITDYSGGGGYFLAIKKSQADAAIDYGAEVFESGDKTLAWVKTNEPDSITDEYVIWYSSDVKLSGIELVNLTTEQKKLAIDEIKARHGVIFTDESVRAYFDSKSWYKGEAPETYFDENSFTEIEKANIELLKS